MANTAAAMRYSSREEEYEWPAAYAQGGAVAIPRPAPRYIPDAVPEAVPEAIPQAEPRVRTKPQVQREYGISLFGICGFLFVSVLFLFVILANVKLTEISLDTVGLQQRMRTLNEQERRLLIKYETAFDVSEIEDYAVSVLGMSKPSPGYAGVINIQPEDYAVVIPVSGARKDAGVVAFLKSLLEYFAPRAGAE